MSQKWLNVSLLFAILARICQALVPGRSPPFLCRLTLLNMATPTSSDATALTERTMAMEARAKAGSPFTDSELDEAIRSIQNIASEDSSIDYDALRAVLAEVAHLSHKDWKRTGDNAERVGKILLPNGMSEDARYMLERIVKEGMWDNAAKHASSQPWAVLVTGVNGIRKTSAIYQPWFPDLLAEALVAPPGKPASWDPTVLPSGTNGFFRQLDHMIAILCNADFRELYALTGEEMKGIDGEPPKEIIQKYSDLKAAIFTRYRTLSELLGVLLLREAQKLNLNCMMETSGRDVAMFHYVDHFFPERYNKLVSDYSELSLSLAKCRGEQCANEHCLSLFHAHFTAQ